MTRVSMMYGCVSLAFTGILALEVLPTEAAAGSIEAHVRPPAAQSDNPRQAPQLGTWTDTAVSRPIFAVNRLPPQSAGMPDAPEPDLPRLAGTIGTGTMLLAFLEPADGKTVAVQVGASVAGWTVRDIGAATIVLERGDRTTMLRLRSATQSPIQTVASVPANEARGVTNVAWPGQWNHKP